MASSGSLQQSKSFAVVKAFNYSSGRARLNKTRVLPAKTLSIPQRTGGDIAIPILNNNAPKKALGVWSRDANHVEELKKKGLLWAGKARNRGYVTMEDNWRSIKTQLQPKLNYGIGSVCAPPTDLDKVMGVIFHNTLSPLGINQKTMTELRTLHEMYRGLGLWDINADCLGLNIHLMRMNSTSTDALGQMMKQAFETFVIDLGFGGDVLIANYKKCHKLAERSWFSNLWEPCHHFGVQLLLEEKKYIQPVRDQNRCFMDAVISMNIFNAGKLQVIGRWGKFKKITLVSCATVCNGLTIEPEVRTGAEGTSRHMFPHKEPHGKGIILWQRAVMALTSNNGKLLPHQGRHKEEPLRDSGWHLSEDKLELYKNVSGNSHQVFRIVNTYRRITHQDVVYQDTHEIKKDHCPSKYASLIPSGNETVGLLSTAARPAPTQRPTTLKEVLNLWPNKALWRHFICSGSGSWIREGLTRGSLVLVHDRSYMKKVDT